MSEMAADGSMRRLMDCLSVCLCVCVSVCVCLQGIEEEAG